MNKRASGSEKVKGRRVRTKLPFAPGLSVQAYHTIRGHLRFINQNANGVLVQCCTVLPRRPDTRTSRFCFLSYFRIKQVLLNSQFPLFVTTDRCFSKCSGVGRVQQAAKEGVCVFGVITFIQQIGHQPGMVANSARGQLNRENRLQTRNRESQHTSHICISRPFRCQCSYSSTTSIRTWTFYHYA